MKARARRSGRSRLGAHPPALVFREVAAYPALYGIEVIRPTVDHEGNAWLACGARQSESGRRNLQSRTYDSWTLGRLAVYKHTEVGWEHVLTTAEPAGSLVQPLGAAAVLVAADRARRAANGSFELNASVYGLDGVLRHRFLIGDGISDVQTTPRGEIWVAYTNAGVMGDYGSYGWGRLSPDEWQEPVGSSGLARFGPGGELRFAFRPPMGLTSMNDCYALNVAGEHAWAAYHPWFPLIRAGAKTSAGWTLDGRPIDAMAVHGTEVLLYTAAFAGRSGCAFGRLGVGRVRDLFDIKFRLPKSAHRDRVRRVVGRGSSLHAFTSDAWYRIDI